MVFTVGILFFLLLLHCDNDDFGLISFFSTVKVTDNVERVPPIFYNLIHVKAQRLFPTFNVSFYCSPGRKGQDTTRALTI